MEAAQIRRYTSVVSQFFLLFKISDKKTHSPQYLFIARTFRYHRIVERSIQHFLHR